MEIIISYSELFSLLESLELSFLLSFPLVLWRCTFLWMKYQFFTVSRVWLLCRILSGSVKISTSRGVFGMRCAIWYHLCNLKNVENTHGGVLMLVKLQAFSLLNIYGSTFAKIVNSLMLGGKEKVTHTLQSLKN